MHSLHFRAFYSVNWARGSFFETFFQELQKIVRDLFLLINETNADQASQEVLVKTAFNEMDENHDGQISQLEFIEACMAQKKFSTMLTLKIIDVFIADEHTMWKPMRANFSEKSRCVVPKRVKYFSSSSKKVWPYQDRVATPEPLVVITFDKSFWSNSTNWKLRKSIEYLPRM